MQIFVKLDIFCSATSTPDPQSAEDINYNDPYSESFAAHLSSLNEVTLINVHLNYQC